MGTAVSQAFSMSSPETSASKPGSRYSPSCPRVLDCPTVWTPSTSTTASTPDSSSRRSSGRSRPNSYRWSDAIRDGNAIGNVYANSKHLSLEGAVPTAWLIDDLSVSGVLGDPRAATRELGEKLVAHQVEALAEALVEIRDSRSPPSVARHELVQPSQLGTQRHSRRLESSAVASATGGGERLATEHHDRPHPNRNRRRRHAKRLLHPGRLAPLDWSRRRTGSGCRRANREDSARPPLRRAHP